MNALSLARTSIACCALALAQGAAAAVLYQQAPADHTIDANFIQADVFGAGTGFAGNQNAENFSLGALSTVTGFGWFGTPVVDPADFVVRLFADPGDTPTTLAGSVQAVATGLFDNFQEEVFEYRFTLAGSPLDLVGDYFLSVLLDAAPSGQPWWWLASNDGEGSSLVRGVDSDPWIAEVPDLSLTVVGERVAANVPEPATWSLLAIAAVAGLGRRGQARR
ncbi:MAG: PEP-CTERM sorting domain-containing protein [Rhodocyclaceae bacterium]|nr:PEP-CTERM sorting domain-containing protein [Rhodocyclaceae bacterium]